MVCIYCNSPTQVINSRLQKRPNQVWRRRRCETCLATITTHERADLSTAVAVRYSAQDIRPFSRDTLYISLYESCKHRSTSIADAEGLSQTITSLLLGMANDGTVGRRDIITISSQVLGRFDKTAAAVYTAFHKA